MALFQGAGVAIVTPFTDDFQVNYEQLGKLIEFQLSHDTDTIIVCGSTGEPSTLTEQEHIECIRYAVEVVHGRVPVIAGTGSNCTDKAIQLSLEAEKAGADGLLVVTPYYNKATQKGLIDYFTDIARAVDLPLILYNVPSRTCCNIEPKTAAYLAKTVDTIVGIKEASGNLSQIASLAYYTEGRLAIYSGNDEQILPILSLGGSGVISVLSNIAPRETHQMVMDYLSGNTKAATAMQLKVIPLLEALFCEVNPIPVKAALNLMGFPVGSLRKPLTTIEEAHKQLLKQRMQEFGLF